MFMEMSSAKAGDIYYAIYSGIGNCGLCKTGIVLWRSGIMSQKRSAGDSPA